MDTIDRAEVERMIESAKQKDAPGCGSIVAMFFVSFMIALILIPLLPQVVDFWAKVTGWAWLQSGG